MGEFRFSMTKISRILRLTFSKFNLVVYDVTTHFSIIFLIFCITSIFGIHIIKVC